MSRSRRSTPLTLLAAVAIALAACTSAPGDSPAASTPTPTQSEPVASQSAPDDATPRATASASAAEPVEVRMDGSDFIPDELTIVAGTEVTFVNDSTFAHTVTEGTGGRAVEDPFVDVEVAGGASESVAFDEPETYEITCRIHPTMQLTITVEG